MYVRRGKGGGEGTQQLDCKTRRIDSIVSVCRNEKRSMPLRSKVIDNGSARDATER